MSNATALKKAIQKRQQAGMPAFELLSQYQELFDALVKDYKQAIADAKKPSVFRDSESVKNTARAVAEEAIAEFKTQVDDMINGVMEGLDEDTKALALTFRESLDRAQEEMLQEAKGDIATLKKELASDIENDRKENAKSLEQLSGAVEKKTDAVVAKLEKAVVASEKKVASLEPREGAQGPAGKDGSPDTPEQIAGKLNNEKKPLLEIFSIKGLVARLQNLENAIRTIARERGGGGGGGGMGNVIHQTFPLMASTTTITLSDKVAAGGNAVLNARYQGQPQFHGRDYTMGSDHKTITILFDHEDSTTFDVTFIRG